MHWHSRWEVGYKRLILKSGNEPSDLEAEGRCVGVFASGGVSQWRHRWDDRQARGAEENAVKILKGQIRTL